MSSIGNVKTDVTAVGADLATAYAIPEKQTFTRVSTAGAANLGVRLPVDAVGSVYIIRNDGANAIRVYPPNANSNINAVGAGAHLALNAGASLHYVITANSALGANGVQFFTF
jgi:hypothetical protein